MTTVAITAGVSSTFDTASANLGVFGAASNTAGASATTGGSAVATTAADGWTISAPTGRNLADGLLVLILSAANTGDTFTIIPGNRLSTAPTTVVNPVVPPSMRGGLASATFVVAANNTQVVPVDVSAHILANGTIVVTSTRTDSNLAAYMLPRGA